jgi:hypothetical protein
VTFALSEHFADVFAIDQEEESVSYAKALAAERGAAHIRGPLYFRRLSAEHARQWLPEVSFGARWSGAVAGFQSVRFVAETKEFRGVGVVSG